MNVETSELRTRIQKELAQLQARRSRLEAALKAIDVVEQIAGDVRRRSQEPASADPTHERIRDLERS
ncbi:MAG: hypothetical protein ACE5JX_00030 [Acidobacteriota bacterium]